MPIDLNKLRAARDLIARPGGWTQGEYARTTSGSPCSISDPSAACFCLKGAMRNVGFTGDNHNAVARKCITKGTFNIITFNDTPGRTQAEVVAVLDAVIAENTLG